MEVRSSALLFRKIQSKANVIKSRCLILTIQDMNMKSSYLGLVEDPSTGHKSTIDLLLNIHTHVLSFKQDSSALENARTLRVTIKLRNFSKVIIVWDTGITNYTIWNDLNRSERSKWVGARFSAAQLGLPSQRVRYTYKQTNTNCHTTSLSVFPVKLSNPCCFSFSLFQSIHFNHKLCFKAKQTLHGSSFVQENILGCPWVGRGGGGGGESARVY